MWCEKIIQHKPWDIRKQWRVILCWNREDWFETWADWKLSCASVKVRRGQTVCVRSDSLITPPASLAWRLWRDTCTARCSGRSGWAGFWVFPARSCAGTPGWGSVRALHGISRLTARRGSTTPQRTSPQTPHAGEKKSIRTSLVLISALVT